MTVAVELTPALTEEGCLEDIPGFLYPQDHWSVGVMQQQYDGNPDGLIFGWGTYAQCVDPEYATRRFLREALKYKGQYGDSPSELGRWCQRVQNSGKAEAYLEKGYPIAKALLEGLDDEPAEPGEWPTRNIGFDSIGWALDLETNAYVRSTLLDTPLHTDAEGWLYRHPTPPTQWQWPVANQPIGWRGDGSYQDLYPTRYNWRSDVEEVARYLVDNYDVSCNTYLNHPPGYWRDSDSLDVWGPEGRGDPLDPDLHDEVFNLIFNNGLPPWIEWTITKGWIWQSSSGWSWWSGDTSEADEGHFRHMHFTFH
jgi:hypothetical protein